MNLIKRFKNWLRNAPVACENCPNWRHFHTLHTAKRKPEGAIIYSASGVIETRVGYCAMEMPKLYNMEDGFGMAVRVTASDDACKYHPRWQDHLASKFERAPTIEEAIAMARPIHVKHRDWEQGRVKPKE